MSCCSWQDTYKQGWVRCCMHAVASMHSLNNMEGARSPRPARMRRQVPTWIAEEGMTLTAEFEEIYELEEEDVIDCSPTLDGVWTKFNLSVTIS